MYLTADISQIDRSKPMLAGRGEAVPATSNEGENLNFLPVPYPPKKKKKKKKKKETEEVGMLEKTSNILTDSAAASAEDKSRSFANLIANKLRNFSSRTISIAGPLMKSPPRLHILLIHLLVFTTFNLNP
jgi:hypothetical protein